MTNNETTHNPHGCVDTLTRDDIIRMAREAGTPQWWLSDDALERFAALIAAAEREACARVVDSYKDCEWIGDAAWDLARDAAEEIRARGEV